MGAIIGTVSNSFSRETLILLCLAAMLMGGFLLTRVTKQLRLPNVSGYILAGILIGPSLLGLVPAELVEHMDFVSDVALAFIAFGVGRFFRARTLRETGRGVLLITLLESLVAGALVFAVMFWLFRLDAELSLLLGAIATATAPASTVMTINQYQARGEFVNKLLQIVALDDVVCLLAFSAAAAVVNALDGGDLSLRGVVLPIVYNLFFLGVGWLFGWLLSRLLPPGRSAENRLILTVALLLALSGLCTVFEVSPLLSCMVFGAAYINLTDDEALYGQLNAFTPPIMLLFFVVSGMNLDLRALAGFGLAGIAYFLVRIGGKYLGAWLGCLITGSDARTRAYLGAALVPQAGVAIGLAYLAQRILPPAIGDVLMSMILASSVLYELIGPACAKFALFRAGAIPAQGGSAAPGAGQKEAGGAADGGSSGRRGRLIQAVLCPSRHGARQEQGR